MIRRKETRFIVWATVLTGLIAGLLVGCALPKGDTDVMHPNPAPSENMLGEVVPGTPMSSPLDDPVIANQVEIARKDLAGRFSILPDQIDLLEVRQVTWPDSSLGCPQAGMTYTQEPQAGLIIRLRAAGSMYLYHSGITSEPFLCENTPLFPKDTPKYDEFVPPPDNEID